ncbi:MAG: hypothetical protein KDK91_29445 [Gammaproteobacteria bacterium]|nr:hypothetical protein [Gammaproteobacteria bacterium]
MTSQPPSKSLADPKLLAFIAAGMQIYGLSQPPVELERPARHQALGRAADRALQRTEHLDGLLPGVVISVNRPQAIGPHHLTEAWVGATDQFAVIVHEHVLRGATGAQRRAVGQFVRRSAAANIPRVARAARIALRLLEDLPV